MRLLLFANLFNVSGLAVVLLVSWLVLRKHPSPFFKHWTRAYGWVFAFVTLDMVGTLLHRPPAYDFVQTACVCTATWYFAQTARELGGKPLPGWTLWAFLAAIATLQTGALALHAPTIVVLGLPTLGLPYGAGSLAFCLLSKRVTAFHGTVPWVGWPLALLALWVLTYPVFAGTSYFWFGYWVSGLLDLLVGVGMVVYLLEEAAEELRRKNVKLEALDEAKSDFLSTVSHELRTPLSSIQGYVELLEDGLEPVMAPAHREYLSHVRHSAAQLKTLIDTLLDSAQLEAGELAIAPEPIELKSFLAHQAEQIRPLLMFKRLSLALELPDNLPTASADHMRLTQVMNNLLSNAIKFTPEDGKIRVAACRRGEMVEIRVSDSGIGIPHDRLDDVFKPFVQLDSSTTRRYGGTGLGLSITRRLVEAMDGEIALDSEPGRGTSACFTLPVSPAAVPLSQAYS